MSDWPLEPARDAERDRPEPSPRSWPLDQLSSNAVGRLRGVARREAADDSQWTLTIGLVSRTPGIGSTATFLVELDREMRRTVSLLEAVRRRGELDYLPLPLRPERGGLRIAEAQAGSLHVDIVLYGILAEVATSNPVAIVSMFQSLWAIGQVSRNKLRDWAIRTDRRDRQPLFDDSRALSSSQMVEQVTRSVNRLAKEQYDRIEVEAHGPDFDLSFRARRNEPL